MARTGTPLWIMVAFGCVALTFGLFVWHRLGSVRPYLCDPTNVTPPMAYAAATALIVLVATEILLSPR
jgi:hypothetical protein